MNEGSGHIPQCDHGEAASYCQLCENKWLREQLRLKELQIVTLKNALADALVEVRSWAEESGCDIRTHKGPEGEIYLRLMGILIK